MCTSVHTIWRRGVCSIHESHTHDAGFSDCSTCIPGSGVVVEGIWILCEMKFVTLYSTDWCTSPVT